MRKIFKLFNSSAIALTATVFLIITPLVSTLGLAQINTNEKVTVTAYYPSPYGVYNELRLTRGHLGMAGECNANSAGTMYFDSSGNVLKICDGVSYQAVEWWAGTYREAGYDYVSDITNKNTGDVVVGLNTAAGAQAKVFSVSGADTNTSRATAGSTQLRMNANGINLSQKAITHPDAAGVNSFQADFNNGAFNFRSWRNNPNPTHQHPWVNFDSTYPEANWQPAFELYPPVAMEGAQAAGMSCDKLCLQKFKPPIGNLDPLVANGVFCWAATGSNNYTTLEGEGTKITCDATNKKYIHCLCGKLGPVSDPPGGW